MTDARPSMDEMWALLQEQRAEIAQLKERLQATRLRLLDLYAAPSQVGQASTESADA